MVITDCILATGKWRGRGERSRKEANTEVDTKHTTVHAPHRRRAVLDSATTSTSAHVSLVPRILTAAAAVQESKTSTEYVTPPRDSCSPDVPPPANPFRNSPKRFSPGLFILGFDASKLRILLTLYPNYFDRTTFDHITVDPALSCCLYSSGSLTRKIQTKNYKLDFTLESVVKNIAIH